MIKDCWAIHRISGRSKELGLEKKKSQERFDCWKCGQGFTASDVNLPGLTVLVLSPRTILSPLWILVSLPWEPKSLMIASDQRNLHPLSYLSGLLLQDIDSGALSPRESCAPYFWTRYPGVGFSGSSTEQYCSSRRWSWARWGWVMWGSCSKEGHILYLWMITLNFCRTEKIKVHIKHGTGHDGKMMAQQVPPSLTFYC